MPRANRTGESARLGVNGLVNKYLEKEGFSRSDCWRLLGKLMVMNGFVKNWYVSAVG